VRRNPGGDPWRWPLITRVSNEPDRGSRKPIRGADDYSPHRLRGETSPETRRRRLDARTASFGKPDDVSSRHRPDSCSAVTYAGLVRPKPEPSGLKVVHVQPVYAFTRVRRGGARSGTPGECEGVGDVRSNCHAMLCEMDGGMCRRAVFLMSFDDERGSRQAMAACPVVHVQLGKRGYRGPASIQAPARRTLSCLLSHIVRPGGWRCRQGAPRSFAGRCKARYWSMAGHCAQPAVRLRAPRRPCGWRNVVAELFDERFSRLRRMGRWPVVHGQHGPRCSFALYGLPVVRVQLASARRCPCRKRGPLQIRPAPRHLLAAWQPSIRGCSLSIRGLAIVASDRFGSAVLPGSLAAGTLRDGRRLIPFDSPTACGSETGNARMANRRGGHRAVLARSQEALFIVFTRGAPFRPRLPSQDQRRD
jgi:hypothetical protein